MEKHLEIFCKQNPTMDIECGNEECKYKTKIKTKDFLNTKYTYKYHCKKCGMILYLIQKIFIQH